ncbi:protein-ADP-ribose hydrolase [Anaerostipes sp.]|uniref:protein-ADP-ribose hydrolase n=1 Tax=Anaerostipes sp. TaxID=1872530 RepID=UPI0025C458E0|nr:protein-ADP-ribose hydrolase [Anaerostipes sp.]MBS7009233.1 protein-ADP-ribose hydrolase [Anaerostipes sp.]
MDQEQRLDYLIGELAKDSGMYERLKAGEADKRRLLRSLMNVRMPGELPPRLLKVQDEYLQEETAQKGIVSVEEILTVKEEFGSRIRHADKISVWQGDITRISADAVVNAANSQMLGCFVPCHGCVDNAIHSAAGMQLREECFRIMQKQGHEEPQGKAKTTQGYNLPCRYVLHTVGPVICGILREEDCMALRSCYQSCMEAAEEKQLASIVFCCISTGEFHFPNERAAKIAMDTVLTFLDRESSIKRVIFNVFKEKDRDIYRKLVTCSS